MATRKTNKSAAASIRVHANEFQTRLPNRLDAWAKPAKRRRRPGLER